MLKGTAREAAAEFFGTFILIAFGVGVVAQTVLSKEANGSYLAINIGWGLAVMLGIYASAGISGAHLNPAVTVALAVHRNTVRQRIARCAALLEADLDDADVRMELWFALRHAEPSDSGQ